MGKKRQEVASVGARSSPDQFRPRTGQVSGPGFRLLIAYALDTNRVVFDRELGSGDAAGSAYLPDARRMLREAWHSLKPQVAAAPEILLLEAAAYTTEMGFPHEQLAVIAKMVHDGIAAVLIEPRQPRRTLRHGDFEISVSTARQPIDRFCRLWQAALTDSSAEIWSQRLAPDSEVEESAMPRRAATATTVTTAEDVSDLLDAIDSDLSTALVPLRKRLQTVLDQLAGKSFDSFEQNQLVADKLRDLMLRIGFRVQCPREGCGQPALIRCNPVRRTRAGSFEFQHPVDGKLKTHAAATVLPALKLAPAPPHRRRKRR